MKIDIEYTAEDLKRLIINDIEEKFNITVDQQILTIQTKSKQNYKSEWETAEFKASYQKNF